MSTIERIRGFAVNLGVGLALAAAGLAIAAASGYFNPARPPEDPAHLRKIEERKTGPTLEEVTKYFRDDPRKTYEPEGY